MQRRRHKAAEDTGVVLAGCLFTIGGVILNLAFWLGLIAGALWLLAKFGVI